MGGTEQDWFVPRGFQADLDVIQVRHALYTSMLLYDALAVSAAGRRLVYGLGGKSVFIRIPRRNLRCESRISGSTHRQGAGEARESAGDIG